MSHSIKKVALTGAKGSIGAKVLDALIEAKFQVTVLTRKAASYPAGVEVKVVDYNSVSSLRDAVKGHDAVIDTTQSDDSETPVRLVEASAAEGVYRFITSDFGLDPDLPGVHDVPVFARKKAAYDAVKAKFKEMGMTYSIITPGAILDWNLATGFAGIQLKEKKVNFFDQGENIMPWTTLEDIGRAAAQALLKPNETLNRPVYIHNVNMSQKQMLDVAKEVLGGEGWEETSQDMTAAYKQAMKDLKAGNITMMTFGTQLQYCMAKEEFCHPFEKDDNALVGVKEMTQDQVKQLIRRLVA